MDIAKILRGLRSIEEKMEILYLWLGELYPDDPAATDLFMQLSQDEKAHQHLIDFQLRLVTQNRKLYRPVEIDLTAVEQLVERINALVQYSPSPELREALETSMLIEQGAVELYCRDLVILSNPDLAKLLHSLNQGFEQHYQRLADFAAQRALLSPSHP